VKQNENPLRGREVRRAEREVKLYLSNPLLLHFQFLALRVEAMGSREAYSVARKLEVVEWIRNEANGIPTRAAKKFKLPPGTVRTWWNQRGDITVASVSDLKRKRLYGAGRIGVFTNYDEELADVILSLREAKQRVTRKTMKDLALTIAKRENLSENDFTASDRWLTRFMQRNFFPSDG
jgi:hypothetical protein